VVISPLNQDWACHRCGGSGGLLIMEKEGPACLDCAGLGDLEVLASGNALLTRRAKAKRTRHAVVVRFSKTRGRYERQGLLVEPQALHAAEREIAEERRG
jgi:predicted NBD/HSP70 family sugar kinase